MKGGSRGSDGGERQGKFLIVSLLSQASDARTRSPHRFPGVHHHRLAAFGQLWFPRYFHGCQPFFFET